MNKKVQKEVNVKYPLAKQHHLIQQLPQFRIIKRGARQKGVERFYQTNDKKTSVTIRMFKELDIADQDLLLAILAIALPVDRGFEISSESKNYLQLWEKLETEGIFTKWQTICIETTFYELAKELNKTSFGGSTKKWIKESLVRLTSTSITIETEKYEGGSNFLSYYIDKESDKVNIAINPVSAVVLLGDNKGYILHNRKERLGLKGTPSKALYSILVGMVNIHQSKTLSTSMLIEKMHFIDWNQTTVQQRKDLKKSFKIAIAEIDELDNWSIIDNQNSTITIKRK
jgi:hypothetical protein